MRSIVVALLLVACGPKKWKATPEQMSPLSPLATIPSSIGPLSLVIQPPSTSSNDVVAKRRLTEERYLDLIRVRAENAALLEVVDTFFQPLTKEAKIGMDQVRRSAEIRERTAPYSMYDVTQSYQQSGYRLGLCVLGAGIMRSCDSERANFARPTPQTTYSVKWADTGIGLVVVHDLTTDATAPPWKSFSTDLGTIAGARGLIIDLRDAAGNDPRPLLPWVARLAGRANLRPLRAIERPAIADRYADAYAAKFTDRGRDLELWRTLVGESSAPAKPTTMPITVLVGRYCHSACELITRMLATYANATVIGSVTRVGRVARDEPALLYLPHSQSTIYFHTTRYFFNADIEAATGPTEEWSALYVGDGMDDFPVAPNTKTTARVVDRFAFAVRDIKYRVDHPKGWPRCDSLPVTKKPNNVGALANKQACAAGVSVMIYAPVPDSAMKHFLATCAVQLHTQYSTSAPGQFHVWAQVDETTLSQIASSELVELVDVSCQPISHFRGSVP